MKRKLLLTSLVAAMLAICVIGGALAYFTDTDSAVNVMTVGNVQIVQNETDAAGNDFKQGQSIYPGTSIDKVVTVTNTGDSNCYFRTWIAVETIVSKNNTYGYTLTKNTAGDYAEPVIPSNVATIDGVLYNIYCFTYDDVLAPGDESTASLEKITLAATVTNEDSAALFGSLEILAYTQAVQTAGFNDPSTALNAAFGEYAPWNADTKISIPSGADNYADLNSVIEAGASAYLTGDLIGAKATTAELVLKGGTLDGNGFTINRDNTDVAVDSTNYGILATGGTIQDITITGNASGQYGFRAVMLKNVDSDVVINNANLSGTYALNSVGDYDYILTVNNSTLTGWVSGGLVGGNYFENCEFKTNDYGTFRLYENTTFENCEFNTGRTFSSDPSVSGMVMTLDNCTFNGVLITAENFADLLDTDATYANALTQQNTVVVNGVTVEF